MLVMPRWAHVVGTGSVTCQPQSRVYQHLPTQLPSSHRRGGAH